jgi:hypothetical protein
VNSEYLLLIFAVKSLNIHVMSKTSSADKPEWRTAAAAVVMLNPIGSSVISGKK